MGEPEADLVTLDGLGLSWAALSDVGKVRSVNEDCFLTAPGLFVVADGMGGHQAGDVASRLTIETCDTLIPMVPLPIERVAELVDDVNRRVHEHGRVEGIEGMGTTLVGMVLTDNAGERDLTVFNVGDSRCYVTDADGSVSQVTTDHSLVQELVDAGSITVEEAAGRSDRNVVTRAIGVERTVAADFVVLPRRPEFRILLCSDGVSGHLPPGRLEALLVLGGSPIAVARQLLDEVLDGRAPDNATAVVVDVAWDREQVARWATDGADEEVTGPRPDARLVDGLIDDVPGGQQGSAEAVEHAGGRTLIDGIGT